jgi:hypothetical protein
LATIARTAGPLVPSDAPAMPRAMTNTHSEPPKAKRVEPIDASSNAARTNRFGLPRSASGARKSCTKNEVRKPEAAMKPSPASENEYLSCRSLRAGKIMLFDTGTANPHRSRGPMPMVKALMPRGLESGVMKW